MKATFAGHQLTFGSDDLQELQDSSTLLGDAAVLRRRMEEEGYLLLRDFFPRDDVLAVRRAFMEILRDHNRLDPGRPLMDGAVRRDDQEPPRPGHVEQMRQVPAFLEVVEGERIMALYAELLGGEPMTYAYKWLRVVDTGQQTGVHYDIVYMGGGTRHLYTAWIPYGDLSIEMGPLAVLEGSHRFDQLKETYGQMDVDRDKVEGWFSRDPLEVVAKFGGRWATSEFRAGDLLTFGMFTMHASLTNVTDRYRITSDTRYQLAAEPADPRWVEGGTGHTQLGRAELKAMTEARREWGLD